MRFTVANPRPLPSQERLLELFRYDPATGNLFHRFKKMRPDMEGKLAGYRKGRTMVVRTGDRSQPPIARVIWKMVTGEDPGRKQVDHIDRNPYNNKWENLRLVEPILNTDNRGLRDRGLPKGVYLLKREPKPINPYVAVIGLKINGVHKTRHLGCYATPQEAEVAYTNARADYLKSALAEKASCGDDPAPPHHHRDRV